jgi:anti-sigma B factor antagonist
VEGVFSTHAAVDEAAGDVVLTVRGEVDFSTAQEFEGTLRNALSDTRRRLVVDLRALRFLDSTGLATLLRLDRRARATSREVIFVKGPAQIRRVFALTGVSELLTMVDEPPG